MDGDPQAGLRPGSPLGNGESGFRVPQATVDASFPLDEGSDPDLSHPPGLTAPEVLPATLLAHWRNCGFVPPPAGGPLPACRELGQADGRGDKQL